MPVKDRAAASDCIDVWFIDLDDPSLCSEVLFSVLSDAEQQRADALQTTTLSNRWKAARVAMRCIVASQLQLTPERVTFGYEKLGKPFVFRPQSMFRSFNLSHSDNLALLAIASAGSIGVDIEKHRATNSILDLTDQFMSLSETQQLQLKPAHEKVPFAYELWTAKEAFLKLSGDGLSFDPIHVSLQATESSSLRIAHSGGELRTANLRYLECPAGFSAAVVDDLNKEVCVNIHQFTAARYTRMARQ